MKSKFKVVKIIFFSILAVTLLLGAAIFGIVAYTADSIDFEADEALFSKAQSDSTVSIYYDERGSLSLSDFEPVLFENISLSKNGIRRYSFEEFSPYLINGFVAMEDRSFFTHRGVDIKRTLAAAFNYVFLSKSDFGGSTITQQVIKNISGDSEKTAKRKIVEIIRAYHLEYTHSKEEIFELYMNIIPMCNNTVGVAEASEYIFGKEPEELNAAEAATVIAIANAPTRYNPYRNPEACTEKRNKVLYAMYTQSVIDEDEYEAARNSTLNLLTQRRERESISWFSSTVINDVINDIMIEYDYSYEAARLFISSAGARVYSTVDPDIQKIVEEYFDNASNFPEEIENGLEYSMVISDSESSALRAIVGSTCKSGVSGYNYAEVLRTPGSTLKPLALYMPLINEKEITWSTVFDDVPVTFSRNSDGEYIEYPQNYPKIYDGLITVSDALCVSKNTVAVKLYNMLGAERIYKNLKDNFGFDSLVGKSNGSVTDLAPSPLALGQLSYGLSLRKLTEAYTVFPREGEYGKGRSYIGVYNKEGELIVKNEESARQICDRECARIMNRLLMRIVDSGTASKITLKNLYDTAGKTGTSGNDMDRFFVGYTPYYTAGIWCGYKNKDHSVGYHEKNHLRIWDEVMHSIHEMKIGYSDDERAFSTENLIYTSFCKDSGNMFSHSCLSDPRGSRLSYGYFIKGTEPSDFCERHILVSVEEIDVELLKDEYNSITDENISLIKPFEGRNFPKELEIADDKYIYRRKKADNAENDKPQTYEPPKEKKRKIFKR